MRLPELVPVTTQGGVGSRCQPAHASCALQPPRGTSLDCRPHIVLSRTAQQWRSLPSDETVSLPACSRRRGAALASRLDPLFSGDGRGRSKALFFAVHNGTSISDPEPANFNATQRTGPTDNPPPSRPQKISSPHGSVLPLVPQLYRFSMAPRMCGARLLQS